MASPVVVSSDVEEEYVGFEEYVGMDDNTTSTEECIGRDCDITFEEPMNLDHNDTNATMVTIGSDGDATFSHSNDTSLNTTDLIGETTLAVSATSYSVVSFPIDMAEPMLFEDDAEGLVAVMCLEREPAVVERNMDEVRTYSVCMLRPEVLVDDDIEAIAKEDDFDGFTSEDCVGGAMVPFEVTSLTEGICIDVSEVLIAATQNDTDVEVSGFSRSLQSSERLFFMIDAMDPAMVGEGDRFYSSEDAQGRQPELTISTGETVVTADEVEPTETPIEDDLTPSDAPEDTSNSTEAPTEEVTKSNSTDTDVNITTPSTEAPTSGGERIFSSAAVLMISFVAMYVAMPL